MLQMIIPLYKNKFYRLCYNIDRNSANISNLFWHLVSNNMSSILPLMQKLFSSKIPSSGLSAFTQSRAQSIVCFNRATISTSTAIALIPLVDSLTAFVRLKIFKRTQSNKTFLLYLPGKPWKQKDWTLQIMWLYLLGQHSEIILIM